MSSRFRDVYGCVKTSNRTGNTARVTVTTVTLAELDYNTGKELDSKVFFIRGFCMIHQGDILLGSVNTNDNYFTGIPLVFESKSKVEIVNLLRDKDHWSQAEAEKEYEDFASVTRMMSTTEYVPFSINRNNLDILTTETINYMVQQWVKLKSKKKQDGPRPKRESIYKWWYENRVLRRLYNLGLNKTIINSCRGRSGLDINELYYAIIYNPYVLEKLPLDKADEIWEKFCRLWPDRRINGPHFRYCGEIIRFVDKQVMDHGHTCCQIEMLRHFDMLPYYNDMLQQVFHCRFRYGMIYLKHFAEIEDRLVKYLTQNLHGLSMGCDPTKLKRHREAVSFALENPVSIVTGGPGTGKSTMIGLLMQTLREARKGVYATSFTGKAVSRLREIVKQYIDRIHEEQEPEFLTSFLNKHIKTCHSLYNSQDVDDCEYLIVDEVSMMDEGILSRLLHKLFRNKEDYQVLFVGDGDQLPSIAPGNLLRELLKAGFPHFRLEENHRMEKDGTLSRNIGALAKRQFSEFRWGDNCTILEGNEDLVVKRVKELVSQGFVSQGFTDDQEITVICPYNLCEKDEDSKTGQPLPKLNALLRDIFIPKNANSIRDSSGVEWKVGDRVMMTANRSDIGVMNGEEGRVITVNMGSITVKFPTCEVKIPTSGTESKDEVKDLDGSEEKDSDGPLSTKLLILSWAITVHKSQGSEWTHVIYYVPSDKLANCQFNNFNMCYTALSRARRSVTCVGRRSTIESSWNCLANYRIDLLSVALGSCSIHESERTDEQKLQGEINRKREEENKLSYEAEQKRLIVEKERRLLEEELAREAQQCAKKEAENVRKQQQQLEAEEKRIAEMQVKRIANLNAAESLRISNLEKEKKIEMDIATAASDGAKRFWMRELEILKQGNLMRETERLALSSKC